ncbi:hypothetical protein GCM10011297_05940 [Bacterioplanes sanyensis]|uniref:hypothetical protein n=1 Tax=Bacterioplanes sanyensis TaxID=1249553 RepID=UPI00167AC05C|nr:hypothetical protein [Bacterioplanes sanyensis]GGY35581.1 hypothetical protein GCM10011297_05940 [Bacterioplanes sanyensis]
MLLMKLAPALLTVALVAASAHSWADYFVERDLHGSWCFHTKEYPDGNQSNEKVSYHFGVDQQLRMTEFTYETRSAYSLRGSRLKIDKIGRFDVLQLTPSQLLLKHRNGSLLHLKRGRCQ